MKKKAKIGILAALVLMVGLVFTGCASFNIKANGTYYSYQYSTYQGKYVATTNRISFNKSGYEVYDASGLDEFGTKYSSNGVVTLVSDPDVYGGGSTTLNVYKNYLVDTSTTIAHKHTEDPTKKSDGVQGIYVMNGDPIMLKKGKLYASNNDSRLEESFTVQIGTYKTKGDFVLMTHTEQGITIPMLRFVYMNQFNVKSSALASEFFAAKAPSLKIKEAYYGVKTTIFAKTEDGKYNLEAISYPSKKAYKNATFGVDAAYESVASIDGKILTISDPSATSVEIECHFGAFMLPVEIDIVDTNLKTVSDAQRTYTVNDEISKSTFVAKFIGIDKSSTILAYTAIVSSNLSAIEVDAEGKISFRAPGTTDVKIVVTFVNYGIETQTVTISKTVSIIVEA